MQLRFTLFASIVILSTGNALAGPDSTAAKSADETRLIDFEVYRVHDYTEVRWVSVGGSNDLYIVERSMDRENWADALRIEGAKEQSHLVEFLDVDNNAPSSKLYYRIKRFDTQGNAVYSNAVVVPGLNDLSELHQTRTIKTLAHSLEIGSEINLSFPNLEHQDLLLVLRNAAGDEYFAKVQYQNKDDLYAVSDVSASMPEGNYIVTATSKEAIHSSHMIIGE